MVKVGTVQTAQHFCFRRAGDAIEALSIRAELLLRNYDLYIVMIDY